MPKAFELIAGHWPGAPKAHCRPYPLTKNIRYNPKNSKKYRKKQRNFGLFTTEPPKNLDFYP